MLSTYFLRVAAGLLGVTGAPYKVCLFVVLIATAVNLVVSLGLGLIALPIGPGPKPSWFRLLSLVGGGAVWVSGAFLVRWVFELAYGKAFLLWLVATVLPILAMISIAATCTTCARVGCRAV
jgi:hypothetical protein